MISQFVSPISDKIFMDYDPGLRFNQRHHNTPVDNKQLETPLEHGQKGLQGHVYMELLVHIYQSINFL